MSAFSDFHEAVDEFMIEFGTDATYHRYGTGTYNPATGDMTATDVVIPVRAILTDMTLRSNGATFKPGTLIQEGDKLVYMKPPKSAPLAIDPAHDRITIGGVKYKVVTFKVVDPTASDAILYEIYVRR